MTSPTQAFPLEKGLIFSPEGKVMSSEIISQQNSIPPLNNGQSFGVP
jgi:hypothetical protein